MYSCGPTVWDFAHIGNFRSFLFADVLKRYLRYRDFEVYHVMNLTDVDDRIASRVREKGMSLREYTDPYIEAFFADLHSLNVDRADVYARATDHIDEMIDLIGKLEKKGLAYRRDGSVYYSIEQFPAYGEFARLDLSGMRTGVRVDTDRYDKDDVRDFVLWKAWTDEDGEVAWDSPFGRGRPGWHLECSAMSTKYLGDVFDIHTGGIDLVFPHHQNEIAQSEGASGHPIVRQWMHNEFMNIDGKGMSKSLGNNIRLQDMGSDPALIRAFRYMVVTSHYRTILNFTHEALEASRSALERLTRLRELLGELSSGEDREGGADPEVAAAVATARAGFCSAMDDDLNSPRAIASVFGLVNGVEKTAAKGHLTPQSARSASAFLDEVGQVLGIFYKLDGEAEDQLPLELPEALAKLIAAREEARSRKEWEVADQLREELLQQGVVVSDGSGATEWTWK
jgi:cysteinyl-tRNA synthetase